MRRVRIASTFDAWRTASRRLLQDQVLPDEVAWIEEDQFGLLPLEFEPPHQDTAPKAGVPVPKGFLMLAERVARHRAIDRWALLYRLLWRLTHGEPDLLTRHGDPDIVRATTLDSEVAAAPVVQAPATPASAAVFLPDHRTIEALREAALRCTACPLHEKASRTVFSAGPADARVMFVGEQPGDQEDLQGQPFVGPAGEVFNRALRQVGLARDDVYITNVVKHFKFERRGKRRIHQTPQAPEIAACRPWLEAEIAAVKPPLIVCLGATAAQALMGPAFRILKNRGRIFETTQWAPALMATVHPSSILRAEDPATQERAYRDFVADLRVAAGLLSKVEAARS